MASPIGTVKLKNLRKVYEERGSYIVESGDDRGQRWRQIVVPEVVREVRTRFRGKVVRAEDVAAFLESNARRMDLPFSYGFKLRYYAQDILIVLVAIGDAEKAKAGRAFEYRVQDREG